MKTFGIALAAALVLSAGAASAQAISEVGVTAGSLDDRTAFGARVGVDAFDLPYGLGLEATYDGTVRQDVVGVNLKTGLALTERLGAYALAGVGYQWSQLQEDQGTWTYGGGLTYDLTERVQLDGRVRVLNTFNDKTEDTLLTVGLNYKF